MTVPLSKRNPREGNQLHCSRKHGAVYTVSRDEKSGLWYVHLEGFPYVPVFGSFRKTKRAAQRIARESNQLI